MSISWVIFAILISLILGLNSNKTKNINKSVSIVIPAYNEEKTLQNVLNTVKKIKCISEIILVDDGSSDNTYKIACENNITVLRHLKNKGKGSAMKTGLKKATGDIILFLDADLKEIHESQVIAILDPILKGNADITKTKFKREAGRVTELTAKPLLQFFFPELNFEQPLSGQFAAIRNFLDKIDLEKDYGVDIGIVLDADALGMRIVEVDIGNIFHDMSTLQELNYMANEVVRTIVDRAMHYGRITMMDDLGNAIRMEIMGLSLISLGIFGVFFIKYLPLIIAELIIVIGIIISALYLIRIAKMSLKIYNQNKISKRQTFNSFIHMHFPVVISIIVLLVMITTLLGSVTISDNEISIEPTSKNLIIPTQTPSRGMDVRGPYTIESALEHDEHIIRLPESSLNTLEADYGDYMYINNTRYQLEQPVSSETDLIRMPLDAREKLNTATGTIIRDSNLKNLFKGMYLIKNLDSEDRRNPDTITNNSLNDTYASIGTIVSTDTNPEKILKVYANNTLICETPGTISNNQYSIYINGISYKTLKLNNNSTGEIFNTTYKNTTIKVELEEGKNGTNTFANSTIGRFINIHINDHGNITNATNTTKSN
ncbi:MAG: glycosyltransferase [Methanobacteriaceae archaeon]|nr:glycosyltransferase [Methanobacteriaceae archaeon]